MILLSKIFRLKIKRCLIYGSKEGGGIKALSPSTFCEESGGGKHFLLKKVEKESRNQSTLMIPAFLLHFLEKAL